MPFPQLGKVEPTADQLRGLTLAQQAESPDSTSPEAYLVERVFGPHGLLEGLREVYVTEPKRKDPKHQQRLEALLLSDDVKLAEVDQILGVPNVPALGVGR